MQISNRPESVCVTLLVPTAFNYCKILLGFSALLSNLTSKLSLNVEWGEENNCYCCLSLYQFGIREELYRSWNEERKEEYNTVVYEGEILIRLQLRVKQQERMEQGDNGFHRVGLHFWKTLIVSGFFSVYLLDRCIL